MKIISIISSNRDGFRRGGVSHPNGPAHYASNYFDKEQLQIIKDASGFVVSMTDINVENLPEGETIIGLKGDTPETPAAEKISKLPDTALKPPEGLDQEVIGQIVAIIPNLKPEDFSKGKDAPPKVGAVEKLLEGQVNANLIDGKHVAAAWKRHQARPPDIGG